MAAGTKAYVLETGWTLFLSSSSLWELMGFSVVLTSTFFTVFSPRGQESQLGDIHIFFHSVTHFDLLILISKKDSV